MGIYCKISLKYRAHPIETGIWKLPELSYIKCLRWCKVKVGSSCKNDTRSEQGKDFRGGKNAYSTRYFLLWSKPHFPFLWVDLIPIYFSYPINYVSCFWYRACFTGLHSWFINTEHNKPLLIHSWGWLGKELSRLLTVLSTWKAIERWLWSLILVN